MRILISKLGENIGKEVEIWGWVYRQRVTKNASFLIVRDSTGIVQVVFKGESDAENTSIESSVKIRGIVKEDKRAPTGIEVEGKSIEIVHKAERFPITKDQSTEFLLDVRHLWVRSQRMNRILKIRDLSLRYFRDFFYKNNFWEVHPPIITKTGAEGGSTLFGFDYFGDEAYLSQTGQLYLEALIYVLERVYSITPSFRAEKSKTKKHLAEFWHLEAEMAWFSNEDNMKLQERMITYVAQNLAENHAPLLSNFTDVNRLKKIEYPFERMKYDEAVEELHKKGFEIKWGDDFGTPHEKALTEELEKPLFVYDWPKEAKAFYMKEDPTNPRIVKCSDLLAPEGHGEIIGGSERIWEIDKLMKRIKEEGLKEDNYKWYIDLRRFGSVPHSGFGLGTERFLKWILNLEHIRDAIPFPRTINRVYP